MKIEEYIKYYKDYNFKEIPFSEVDALILTMLTYLPSQKLRSNITLETIKNDILNLDESFFHGTMEHYSKELLSNISNTKRYKDIKLYNYVKTTNNDVQFSAVTYRCNEFTFVGYEGSNSSVIGWVENFMLACTYPTKTQVLASEYLNNTITLKDKVIYVAGHSKGGNLAMTAVMNAKKSIYRRIKDVYNFDGPGFRPSEINTPEFKNMNLKCHNYLPSNSLVGIILSNKNYQYISADGVGFDAHFLHRWNLFGSFIIKENELSKTSLVLKNKIDHILLNANDNNIIGLIESLRTYSIKNNIVYVSDLKGLKLNDFIKIIEDYKEIDPKLKTELMELLKLFFTQSN